MQEILREQHWPEDYIRAIVAHGWGICSETEPRSALEQVLYAVDELCGLVAAAALVRPSKSILDLQVKSVKKKWKDNGFAAGVDRSVIERGAQRLGMELDQLIAEVIEGMKPVAAQIGLAGES